MKQLCLALVVVVFTSCAHLSRSTVDPLDLADEPLSEGSTSPERIAFSGWNAFLKANKPDDAAALFERALSFDEHNALALSGLMMLAHRLEHPPLLLKRALDLLERAPDDPTAIVAARFVLQLSGTAESIDTEIDRRVPLLLNSIHRHDVAHPLRVALGYRARLLRDGKNLSEVLASSGTPSEVTLMGPFSPWHVLSMAEALPIEKTSVIDDTHTGPYGRLTPRVMKSDGRFTLAGEPLRGDLYVFAADATVRTKQPYVLQIVSAMDFVATLDNTTVATRSTWQRQASTTTARAMLLTPGTHRLLLRVSRENQQGHVSWSLAPANGSPSDVTWAAATGTAPGLDSPPELLDVDSDTDLRTTANVRAFYEVLRESTGSAIAAFLAATDGIDRDRDGARALTMQLKLPRTAAFNALLAEIENGDPAIPPKVARGRATRDCELALSQDPGYVRSAVRLSQMLLDDGRRTDALGVLGALPAALRTTPAVLLQRARIELFFDLESAAVETALELNTAMPGSCEAARLRYDLARRRDSIEMADTLIKELKHCSGTAYSEADHLSLRGKLEEAATVWKAELEIDPSFPMSAERLSAVQMKMGAYAAALETVQHMRAVWPRDARWLVLQGDVLEHLDKRSEAYAARAQALLLEGADLSLRRLVERATTGKELLSDTAIATEAALAEYNKREMQEEANAAFLLDAATIRAYPDGTQVDRIHILQKALNQDGVQEVAEVQIPPDAQVLQLRTLKPDGSTLEPERIEGKDGISLPGVQVGDIVEYEYLQAHPTRGAAQPGFTASNFYFQVAHQPNHWSTYTVIAPKGSNMKVDAHNMPPPPPPKVQGEDEVFFHEERHVRPYIPEPLSPPAATEWLPFVSVGSGTTGNDDIVRSYADVFITRGIITPEVDQFAKEAAGDSTGLEAVRRVYGAVMQKLTGRDSGLSYSASATVAQDRGSRTWLIKSALTSLGFDARLVLVRTFAADPAPYLFPNDSVLPYVCVRVTMPNGQVVWLDGVQRFAPFGELPEFALGEREAYLLPEPGKPLERVKTPTKPIRPNKEIALELTLTEEGILQGTGSEAYVGYEAAQIAEILEGMSLEQRNQALEQALARYFGGSDIQDIQVDIKREVGAPVTVKYRFVAPKFGRLEGLNRLVLGPLTFPIALGQRFQVGSGRTTPLMIEGTEAAHTVAHLTLPDGWKLNGPVESFEIKNGKLGVYQRKEKQVGALVTVEEFYRHEQARISLPQLDAFERFSGEVDLLQSRDLLVEKK